jgi:hypothetical protein
MINRFATIPGAIAHTRIFQRLVTSHTSSPKYDGHRAGGNFLWQTNPAIKLSSE